MHKPPYTYRRDSDGTDETFDILDGKGKCVAISPFWEDAGKAEATARMIVGALNRFRKLPEKSAA